MLTTLMFKNRVTVGFRNRGFSVVALVTWRSPRMTMLSRAVMDGNGQGK